MVFVLDNYDSFTYNLVQYIGELGEEVIVRRNDEITPQEIVALKPTRIVLSPGPCTPQEAGILIPLIQHLAKLPAAKQIPTLGVCLGHQAIGAGANDDRIETPIRHGNGSHARFTISSAAMRPDAPMMPPPGCVPDPHCQ